MNTVDTDLLARIGLGGTDPSAKKASDQLGQSEFLKLMTTQLENQDPFDPMESGAFLGQLAQFATVSGIGDLQTAFGGLAQSLQSGQALQAAALVDRQVMVPADMALMDPEQGQWGAVEVPASMSEVEVGVYDQSGVLVQKLSLGPRGSGLNEFRWDGRTDAGAVAPPGIYEFRAQGQGVGRTEALDVFLAARVESVSLGNRDGSLTLQVEGLGEIDFSKVRRIG